MARSHRASVRLGAGLLVATLACVNLAFAAAQRSFVSTTGVDNPSCSIASPCRSFGAAISATNPGGEVVVQDSGGYGPVTITQSVSIIAPPGVYAGISVSSGNGVTVTTAATDVVTLRGLTINNIGTGTYGINFDGAGRLQVADISATGFSGPGLRFFPSAGSELFVERSNFSGNSRGIGIYPGAGIGVEAMLDGVRVHHNNDFGIFVVNDATVTVRNSVIASNSTSGVGVFPQEAGSNTDVILESTEISSNGDRGVWAGDPNGGSAVTINGCTIVYNDTGIFTAQAAQIRLAGTTISRNATGIQYDTGGLALSQGNNMIDGNGTDGAAPTIVGAK
jgi:hypothetical protein